MDLIKKTATTEIDTIKNKIIEIKDNHRLDKEIDRKVQTLENKCLVSQEEGLQTSNSKVQRILDSNNSNKSFVTCKKVIADSLFVPFKRPEREIQLYSTQQSLRSARQHSLSRNNDLITKVNQNTRFKSRTNYNRESHVNHNTQNPTADDNIRHVPKQHQDIKATNNYQPTLASRRSYQHNDYRNYDDDRFLKNGNNYSNNNYTYNRSHSRTNQLNDFQSHPTRYKVRTSNY